jgi:hypothetical protein
MTTTYLVVDGVWFIDQTFFKGHSTTELTWRQNTASKPIESALVVTL